MSVIFNQSWPGKGRSSNFRNIHKKYTVVGGNYHAKTDTLTEAKQAGNAIAKRDAWRGKWNIPFLPVAIYVGDAPGSMYNRPTGWVQYVPVRGTGMSAEAIIAAIKRRHGVAPFKWTKR